MMTEEKDDKGKEGEFKTVLDMCASQRGRSVRPPYFVKSTYSKGADEEKKFPEGEFIG